MGRRNSKFANDIIVVEQRNGTLKCSAVNVRFPNQKDVTNWDEKIVTVSINCKPFETLSLNQLNPRNESNVGGYRFPSQWLKNMRLRPDLNNISFTINFSGEDVEVKARMFLWPRDSRIVITDVDGTITKSDLLGLLSSIIRFDWIQHGVCHLFSVIQKNGYKVIYLTGRPRYFAEATHDLLDNAMQDGKALPKGPVIVSPEGWRAAINREVDDAQDEKFKIPVLMQIRELFSDDYPKLEEVSPFYAGFGNHPSDRRTYRKFGIPCQQVFHVNRCKKGIEVKCDEDTVDAFFYNSYRGLLRFVHCFFPRVQDCATPNFARRVKEYFKSLFRPYHCCGNRGTDKS